MKFKIFVLYQEMLILYHRKVKVSSISFVIMCMLDLEKYDRQTDGPRKLVTKATRWSLKFLSDYKLHLKVVLCLSLISQNKYVLTRMSGVGWIVWNYNQISELTLATKSNNGTSFLFLGTRARHCPKVQVDVDLCNYLVIIVFQLRVVSAVLNLS